jgi:hypothetical protein
MEKRTTPKTMKNMLTRIIRDWEGKTSPKPKKLPIIWRLSNFGYKNSKKNTESLKFIFTNQSDRVEKEVERCPEVPIGHLSEEQTHEKQVDYEDEDSTEEHSPLFNGHGETGGLSSGLRFFY